MTIPTSLGHEAAMLSRALHEGRPLAAVAGVPETSLAAARELAGWAAAVGETSLAVAMWEGCAALDDAPESWLGLAAAARASDHAQRSFEAASRAGSHPAARGAERAAAALLCARACLLAERHEDARRWLATIPDDAEADAVRLARGIEVALRAREGTPHRQER